MGKKWKKLQLLRRLAAKNIVETAEPVPVQKIKEEKTVEPEIKREKLVEPEIKREKPAPVSKPKKTVREKLKKVAERRIKKK